LTQTTSTFDLTAASFDRYRSLPNGVPEAIRTKIRESLPKASAQRVLDLGAGTGRIGRAFVQANDFYVGVDSSLAMLWEFARRNRSATLLQADGRQLPFLDRAFGLVLLMQMLSGAENWQAMLQEVLRVLSPGGAVVVGQTIAPTLGIDAQLKQRLALILEELNAPVHEPKRSRYHAFGWLEARAGRHTTVTAAKWSAERSPEQFIERHQTGARFAVLPPAVQNDALQRLSAWAKANFGRLDKSFTEQHSFQLDIFQVG
jgi:ubiquinone/menaquinone biosynthesis C-methylase UbiE